MGTIHLGLPGPWAKSTCESSDHYTTKIGGVPDWPSKGLDIKPDILTCRICGRSLCLVAQLYTPLSLNDIDLEERNLYVFGCSIGKCASNSLSWRALRIQKGPSGSEKSETCLEKRELADSTLSMPTSSLSNEDLWTFGDGRLDDEKDSDMDLDQLNRALSQAAMAASNCRKHVKAKQPLKVLKIKERVSVGIPALPCFYVYSQEEPHADTLNDISTSCSSLSLKENQNYSSDLVDEEKWEGEVYEYDKALQADRTYLKFKKRVDLFPEQCFRYSFGGVPLLAVADAGEAGICSFCGAARHYEVQLMPALLYFLHESVNDASANSDEWDWTTVIIYTCSNSCSGNEGKAVADYWTVVEEAIVVQV